MGEGGSGSTPGPGATGPAEWWREFEALDVAVYAAIAATPTPTFDRAFSTLSHVADFAKLWVGAAALLGATGGRSGRRAAVDGLASLGVTAVVLNLILKPLGDRTRPDRTMHGVPEARHVRMPESTSFPSGHSATAFAFASGVARTQPFAGAALHGMAALVAYSRVHTGVHYPIDAIVGSVVGAALAPVTTSVLDRRRRRPSG